MNFPKDFIWGAATAAYQIEGAFNQDGRGESIWDRFSKTPGKVLRGHTGDLACDHYNLFRRDLRLIAGLGVDSYRFSIAWPRIFPRGSGKVNSKGLGFYKELLMGLQELGIRPAATLYHWDLPQALENKGGWLNRDTAYYFRDYAALIFQELGDLAELWITLNEPWCSAYLGYGSGEHAPGIRSPQGYLQAAHNLLLAHGLALQAYREENLSPKIGISLNLIPQEPVSQRPEDLKAARLRDGFQNRWYLDPLFRGEYPRDLQESSFIGSFVQEGDFSLIAAPLDFLGINYYSRDRIGADKEGRPVKYPAERELTAMGWEVYPQGLFDLLSRVDRDYGPLPLYITENGAAFEDTPQEGRVADFERKNYLKEHFAQAARAVEAGVPLKGYYVWSLLDNFEWAYGYERRFGLIYVDFKTQKRILKDSGRWFRSFLKGSN
ncbi:MAG: beta-glucosidase [Firmicutes bacterium]|nr:beta-glucosidase [Bacillota bacterium]